MRTFRKNFRQTISLACAMICISQAAWADDYDSVCKDAKPGGQKAEYCAAAKQAKSASQKENTLFTLYAATAGVCVAACATSVFGGWGDAVCSGSDLATATADIALTKQFTSGLNLLIGGFGLMDALEHPGQQATTQLTKNGKEIRNCWITAATASIASMIHKSSSSTSKQTYDQNLQAAKLVTDSSAPMVNVGGNFDASNTSGTATQLAAASSTAIKTGAGGGNSAGDSNTCGGAGVASAVSCAATADPNLANHIADPTFQKAFEKSSGMPLADYLKKAGSLSSAGDAVKAAAGGVIGDDNASKMDQAFAAAQNAMPQNYTPEQNSAYASSGGKGGSGSSGDDELASMMKGLMSQLAPKNADEKSGGLNEVKFGGPRRNLASVTAEDPTVSLFDRVAFRYANIAPRLQDSPQRPLQTWTLPKN